jgi:hypothetical protein
LREKGEHAGKMYHGTGAEDVEWEAARLREKGEHAGEVYHGTGAEDVEWEAAWPLMKLSPAVHAQVVYVLVAAVWPLMRLSPAVHAQFVYVLVAAVSSSLVLRQQHLQVHYPGRHGRNS